MLFITYNGDRKHSWGSKLIIHLVRGVNVNAPYPDTHSPISAFERGSLKAVGKDCSVYIDSARPCYG